MKRILQTILLLTIVQAAQAQLKIGMRFAPQITWSATDNKNSFSNGSRINAAYGLILEYYFTENYALGTELSIQYFGTNQNIKKEKYTSVDYRGVSYPNVSNLNFDYRLRYFQIPLILKMRTNEIGHLRYYGEFGFNAGILTLARADMSTTGLNIDEVNVNEPDADDAYTINPVAYSDDVNVFKAGLVIGAGIQHNFIGNSLLQVGLRYEDGLVGYMNDDRLMSYLNYLALNIGVLF
jgi:hypothetical protein